MRIKETVLVGLLLILVYTQAMMGQDWTHNSQNWIELTEEDGFVLDMKYATTDNFINKKVYDCERCFLRPKVATQLIKANQHLHEQGFAIKLFDCYRPLKVQWELWEEVPNPNYVADPRKGSMHNRGQAVDLTLVKIETKEELAMGTGFDFFGKEAHHDYTSNLSGEVQANRQLLKSTMEKFDLEPIRTEWWHYSYREGLREIHEEKWNCPE